MMASKLRATSGLCMLLLGACQPETSGPAGDHGSETVGEDTSVSEDDGDTDESTDDGGQGAVCGNGEIEPGETCDGDCPEDCGAPDACTNFELVGEAEACTAECVEVQNETCGPKDGCCPGGCNTPDDEDCTDGDRDGLGDVMEGEQGTDPSDPDSDDDGFYDWDEVLRGTDPLDPAEYPPAYQGLSPYAGDTHVHGSTAMELVTLYWGYDYSDCSETQYIGGNQPHSHVWCDRLFERGKVNGLDWMVQTSHDFGITDWLSDHGNTGDYKEAVLEFWKQNPDFADPYFGDDPDYRYPTHPDGFPLYTEDGHTGSEWLSLQNCAEYETEPGNFVAFGGIEYTAQAGGDGCGPNPYCGGHKTVMYLHTSDKVCTATYQNPTQSCNETQLYEHIREKGGVANIAHPDWLGPKLVPHDPNTAISGIDDSVLMGVELRFGSNLDLEEAKPNHSYRDMLDLGFRTQPVYGSDTHQWPEDTCGSSQGPGKGPNGPRTVCWGTALNRGELLGSFLQHRCYYASKGKPELRFEVEGRPIGSKLRVNEVADADAGLSIVVDVQRKDGESVGEWDLIHDGEVILADMPCDPSGDGCHWEGTVSGGDLTGYYYVRVTDGETPTDKRIISSPVWIEP